MTPDPNHPLSSLPIGIFDSGLGGLTVWRELRRQLPHERWIYLGDTARVPYGQRSPSEIVQYTRDILAWMECQPVKLVVMACNTSSALALDVVRQECALPLLGLIMPGAQAAVGRGSRIGVLATSATVASHAYQRAIWESAAGRTIQCWEQECPALVPLIEAGRIQDPELAEAARSYLQPLLAHNIDTLVYGCTHYPLIDDRIRSLLPRGIRRVDPAVALAAAVARELDLWGLRGQGEGTRFCVSGDPVRFADLAATWLGGRPTVEQVDLARTPARQPGC